MFNEDKLGLYKRQKLEKVQKELEQIQCTGEKAILLIAKRLEQELINQGYNPGVFIQIWHFDTSEIQVQVDDQRIGGRRLSEDTITANNKE
jgi:hypothetical protein